MIITNKKIKNEIGEKDINKFINDFANILKLGQIKQFIKVEEIKNNKNISNYYMIARDSYGDKFTLVDVQKQEVLLMSFDGASAFVDLVKDFITSQTNFKNIQKITNIHSGSLELDVSEEKAIIVGSF